MSAPPPRWPTGPGRSPPPSAPWAPTAPTLVGRAAIGASGLGVGGGLAGAGGGGGAMGASASAQQPACACVGGDTCERRGCETVCVRFEHATAAHAVASEPAELLAGKRVVERGARLPAALEGAGVLGRRGHGEQGEQGKAGRSHLVVGHAVVGLTCATAITTCAMELGARGRGWSRTRCASGGLHGCPSPCVRDRRAEAAWQRAAHRGPRGPE